MGCALKGLDAALDALSKEQKAQEAVASKYQSKTKIVTSENSDGVTSVTVSLPSSRQASRLTSRRGSIGKQFSNSLTANFEFPANFSRAFSFVKK